MLVHSLLMQYNSLSLSFFLTYKQLLIDLFRNYKVINNPVFNLLMCFMVSEQKK